MRVPQKTSTINANTPNTILRTMSYSFSMNQVNSPLSISCLWFNFSMGLATINALITFLADIISILYYLPLIGLFRVFYLIALQNPVLLYDSSILPIEVHVIRDT